MMSAQAAYHSDLTRLTDDPEDQEEGEPWQTQYRQHRLYCPSCRYQSDVVQRPQRHEAAYRPDISTLPLIALTRGDPPDPIHAEVGIWNARSINVNQRD